MDLKNKKAKVLKILTYPNLILTKASKEVDFPLSNSDKILIEDMWETVKGQGVGLAAPQVGFDKKICIIHLSEDGEGRGKESPKKDFVMINPIITFKSQVKNSMVEGCLSFPEEFYEILRPANIEVEYFDEKGKKKKLKAKGWLSRVIQHEVDHLEGVVFTKLGGRKLSKDELESGEIQILD